MGSLYLFNDDEIGEMNDPVDLAVDFYHKIPDFDAVGDRHFPKVFLSPGILDLTMGGDPIARPGRAQEIGRQVSGTEDTLGQIAHRYADG